MKIKAFSLIENLVALTILAFVFAASLMVIGGLFVRNRVGWIQIEHQLNIANYQSLMTSDTLFIVSDQVSVQVSSKNDRIREINVTVVQVDGHIMQKEHRYAWKAE